MMNFLIILCKRYFVVLGVISTFLEIINYLSPNSIEKNLYLIYFSILFGLVLTIIKIIPTKKISQTFKKPNITINIIKSDIFNAKNNIVIGMSDTFDTKIGKIISEDSIQGKLLLNEFDNDQNKLDSLLNQELSSYPSEIDHYKKEGKNQRYQIGTTVVIKNKSKDFYCVAYSKMNNNLNAETNINNIQNSLNNLWEIFLQKGNYKTLSIPVIGTGTARLGNFLSYNDLIKLIINSFILKSREKAFAKELNIYIFPNDSKNVNFIEIKDYLINYIHD